MASRVLTSSCHVIDQLSRRGARNIGECAKERARKARNEGDGEKEIKEEILEGKGDFIK